jgi:hypothetical protein
MKIVNDCFDGVPDKTTTTVWEYFNFVLISEDDDIEIVREEKAIPHDTMLEKLSKVGTYPYIVVFKKPSSMRKYFYFQKENALPTNLMTFSKREKEVAKNGAIEEKYEFYKCVALAFKHSSYIDMVKNLCQDTAEQHTYGL